MQGSKKLKGWEKESVDIKVDGQNIRKEVDTIKTTLKMLQNEVDRILKALGMKTHGEELRERMELAEKRMPL